ncbi:redoxin domain-containing protein [Candidatus Peregrinibacteria bacterium]|nr:redoxin domain-containing protein [Candidatus Peregrinibacteria bacterium]
MMLALTLFVAGVLTILLPCILPLIPIVLGVSIAGRSRWRPVLTVLGMVVSFVGFSFLLLVVLDQFVEFADYIRIATYYILILFGLGFLTHSRPVQLLGAIVGSTFFLSKGLVAVIIGAVFGVIALELGGRMAACIQQFGVDVQQKTEEEFGRDSPWTAFVIGLTLGLVWVPCAGPALGFAFTLVRDEPGPRALLALASYGLGTGVPLLAIGYGGQAAVHSVRAMSRYTGMIKKVAGLLLIVTAIALQFRLFERAQIWLLDHTNFGDLGTRIEEKLFERDMFEAMEEKSLDFSSSSTSSVMAMFPKLPKITRAPEFTDLGPWHNSESFTLESLRGKVVLVDFWTYSCINCIRTLPYIQGYWEKFGSTSLITGKNTPFVLIGVHTPEFVFEKSEKNVAEAIKRHGLTYPVAQDNDYGTWKAFSNHYWPAKYLIDTEGYIRYTHFGEGAYEETDLAIQSLLQEIGVTMDAEGSDPTSLKELRGAGQSLSPETYLGTRSIKQLGNGPRVPTGKVVTYIVPEEMELHHYYLVGDWQIEDGERQILRSKEGEIRMKFLGGEINLVLGSASQASQNVSTVAVEVDGERFKTIEVEFDDLYELWKGPYGEHEIILRIRGAGLSGYAFTFGS